MARWFNTAGPCRPDDHYMLPAEPWLANALAQIVVDELVPDPAQAVTAAAVDRAKEILIDRREVHLDSLAARLDEPRIRAILEPMLAGELLGNVPEDDRRFAMDLGLVRASDEGGLEIANPIYREVIARRLAGGVRATLPRIEPSWLKPDGRLDPDRLLTAFLAFWRQHGEPLLRAAPYAEVAPHLVLMAFLDRVANGGGTLEREYAIGTGRMDLCLRHGGTVLGIELKVWRDGRKDPLAEGLAQLDGYLAGLGAATGWLVIFDQRSGQLPIEQRTSTEPARTPSGRRVTLIRA